MQLRPSSLLKIAIQASMISERALFPSGINRTRCEFGLHIRQYRFERETTCIIFELPHDPQHWLPYKEMSEPIEGLIRSLGYRSQMIFART